MLGRAVKAIPSRPAFAANHSSDPLKEAARIFSPATSAQPIDHQPELHA
jgi:hypothetical protein